VFGLGASCRRRDSPDERDETTEEVAALGWQAGPLIWNAAVSFGMPQRAGNG
jgi:hypothetical protein